MGHPIKIVGVVQDITGRKHAEEAQRAHAGLLAQIIATQGQVVQQQLDQQQLMNVVVERLPELTGASGAVVELVDGDEMFFAAATGTAAQHIGIRLKVRSSFSGLSVLSDRTLLCNDTEDDPRVDRDATRAVQARSMLVTPLSTTVEW